jgi:hypothetical protein
MPTQEDQQAKEEQQRCGFCLLHLMTHSLFNQKECNAQVEHFSDQRSTVTLASLSHNLTMPLILCSFSTQSRNSYTKNCVNHTTSTMHYAHALDVRRDAEEKRRTMLKAVMTSEARERCECEVLTIYFSTF